ncbi:ABC transporter family substrate-binding protein [Streptomyces sp. WMMC500]|uniref:ABC transporter family substrate-binding protein n=1 Tax=Streptomyces sp. WMMC500 TaxID=3015154 RepID=UPI00248AC204|nr:ABC transporter family substrate-binding protein [Streptomyces sp. WMMC500]WBB63317.1 ABC transporter family substrate-binding protein [Streptomyces sp. WMMC500]
MSLHSRRRYAAVLIAAGVTLPLAGCDTSPDDAAGAAHDVTAVSREQLRPGGTVRWAVDRAPETFNVFQADAGEATDRVAGAVLPRLFTLDEHGRPTADPDYLQSAEVEERRPKQRVVYRLNPRAVWSDGRPIGAEDFEAQWLALNGEDTAYWTARNAGYDRIESVEAGEEPGEVEVVFDEPYADWQALFSPLYPMSVTKTPKAFNEGARTGLAEVAGPFMIKNVKEEKEEKKDEKSKKNKKSKKYKDGKKRDGKKRDGRKKDGEKKGKRDESEASEPTSVTLVRNPRWWGDRALLDRLVFAEVPRGTGREKALDAGRLDIAEVERDEALEAARAEEAAVQVPEPDRAQDGKPAELVSLPKAGPRPYTVHRALEPAHTQLALNGSSGPLADERVRRAVARAVDRGTLARSVLGPHGLPAKPLGSHLLMPGQPGYSDQSAALGKQDVVAAQKLLAEAGWKGGPRAGEEEAKGSGDRDGGDDKPAAGVLPTYEVPLSVTRPAQAQHVALGRQAALWAAAAKHGKSSKEYKMAVRAARLARAALAERETSVAQPPRQRPFVKRGKPLTLRFVVPEGPGTEQLRTVASRVVRMMDNIGVRTEVVEAAEPGFFKDYIAAGEFDLALYSWPGTPYPATDARPIYAKPVPSPDGSLVVEQNYTRVGTDEIDQLFGQAISELDDEAAHELLTRADARIWAAAGSIPLYQRPQLVATTRDLANAGAFGFATPRYQDIGYRN